MIPSTTIAALAKLGLNAEQVDVVASLLSEVEQATRNECGRDIEGRRAADRERKQRQRSREVTGQDVTGRDNAETVSPPPVPPQTPPITPTPSDDCGERATIRSSTRGKRIPADWTPRDAERDLAASWGWSPAEIDDQLERFRDYWLARSGREAIKTDWDRTFRNRLKDLNDRRNRTYKPASASDKQSTSAGFDALDAEIAGRGYGGEDRGADYEFPAPRRLRVVDPGR